MKKKEKDNLPKQETKIKENKTLTLNSNNEKESIKEKLTEKEKKERNKFIFKGLIYMFIFGIVFLGIASLILFLA